MVNSVSRAAAWSASLAPTRPKVAARWRSVIQTRGPAPWSGGAGRGRPGAPRGGGGQMVGVGQSGPPGGHVAADAGRGGDDEALDQVAVDGLDVGVVAGRLGDGPEQG